MDITLKLSKDFERCLEDLKKKYGEDFEYINGLHPSQLDFSEFIDNFVDKDTLADASIDPNANANHKDIRSFMTEKAKSEDKLFGLNKIFHVITPKGIATLAMLRTGLIQSTNDPRFEGFWQLFESDMERLGYIVYEQEVE